MKNKNERNTENIVDLFIIILNDFHSLNKNWNSHNGFSKAFFLFLFTFDLSDTHTQNQSNGRDDTYIPIKTYQQNSSIIFLFVVMKWTIQIYDESNKQGGCSFQYVVTSESGIHYYVIEIDNITMAMVMVTQLQIKWRYELEHTIRDK